MLSLESEIIDATTEDGKKVLDKFMAEEQERQERQEMSIKDNSENGSDTTAKGKEPGKSSSD